uniref:Uncharacterized protein n=1 Tax=Caenorhabditis japonica TaxID=281687 RepID=A0A8R1ESD4_CAEJA
MTRRRQHSFTENATNSTAEALEDPNKSEIDRYRTVHTTKSVATDLSSRQVHRDKPRRIAIQCAENTKETREISK